MVSEQLQKKIDRAIKLLQSVAKDYDKPIELAYSGGKDSDVILQLAKEAGINYRAIYKNTTIDPKGTLEHVRKMGVEIMQPKMSFFEIVKFAGTPTRFRRICCSFLKEYKILDKAIIGVRKEESAKRMKLYNEPTRCVYYNKKKTEENHVEQIMPILDWTLKDVTEFIEDRGIVCAPIYYDGGGEFHPERRLGCLCCPVMSTNKRREEFKKNPNILKAYIKAADMHIKEYPTRTASKYFKDGYEQMVFDIFFNTLADFNRHKQNMFGEEFDAKKELEDYFKVKL